MSDASDDVAIAAINRIREEVRREVYQEAFKAGWEACAAKTARAIKLPARIPSSSTAGKNDGVLAKFMDSRWPKDVDEDLRSKPLYELDILDNRLFGMLAEAVEKPFSTAEVTIGDILMLSPPALVGRSGGRGNGLGEIRVGKLLRALKTVGIEPIYGEPVR